MKFILRAIICVCLLQISYSAQSQILLDKIIATVGSENVLKSDVEAQINYLKEQNPDLPADANCIILDQLMSNALMVHRAKVDSVLVSDIEVEGQLDARIDRILTMMGNDMEQFLNQYGKSPNEIKDEQREDLRNQLLGERMQGQVMQGATITPSEVITFFDQIHPDSLPYFNSEVEIGEIVYKPVVNDEEVERARAKLENIRNQIVNEGADFAKLALENSEDYGSGQKGGDLGYAPRGSYVTEFEATAYNLDINEISELVETEFGFHLLQLMDKRGNSLRIRHILVRPQISQIDFDNAQVHMDSVRNMIISDTIPFSYAVKRFSDDKVQSYNNDGRIVNPKTGKAVFDVGDLDPDIYFTIDDMEVGEMSQPFQVSNGRGETEYKIIKLLTRTEPHRASLKTDYARIQEAALQQKKAGYMENWMLSKIGSAYVFLTDEYAQCPSMEKWQKDSSIRP